MPVLLLAALALAAQQPQPTQPDQAPRRYSRPFISPMGEPFEGKDALDQWFRQADTNGDGSLSPAELQADAARFFTALDTTKDGEIDPEDVQRYETVIAPFIHVGSGGPVARPRFTPSDQNDGSNHHGQTASGKSMDDESNDSSNSQGSTPKVVLPTRQGAGWFGLLNIAEPVTAADTNLDRGVSTAEFERAASKRFQMLDSNHDGLLSLPELRAFLP